MCRKLKGQWNQSQSIFTAEVSRNAAFLLKWSSCWYEDKISMCYEILCDQREFFYQQPNMRSTWRTPAALSLCTQEWHHKSILLQLRHYDIRYHSILYKKPNVHLYTCPCINVAIYFLYILHWPNHSHSYLRNTLSKTKNHLPPLTCSSSLSAVTQSGLSPLYHSKPFHLKLFGFSQLNKKLCVKFVKVLCGRSLAPICDNSTLHYMPTIKQERNFSHLA